MVAGSFPLLQNAPPPISVARAEKVAFETFGIVSSATSLGSHQDRNFLLSAPDGPLLLKFSNPSTMTDELIAQNAAIDYLARRSAPLRIPSALPTRDGERVHVTKVDGMDVAVRLLHFVEGGSLSGDRYLRPAVVRAIGGMAATIDLALAELSAPALERPHQWDLQRSPEVLDGLLPFISDSGLRSTVESASREAALLLEAIADELPRQLIHGDLTDDNVVALPGMSGIPDGVIDFGDLNYSWTVGELAVTISSLLHHRGGTASSIMEAVAAYHAIRPLSRIEAEALWPLVVIRGAVLVASGFQVASTDSLNRYAADNLQHELIIFDRATAVPLSVATALVLDTLGMARESAQLPPCIPLLPDLNSHSIASLDLSATSSLLDAGRWRDPAAERDITAQVLRSNAAVVTRYAQARLTRSGIHSSDEPSNVVLGIELTVSDRQRIVAPWDGTVESTPDGLELHGHGTVLSLVGMTSGAEPGTAVTAGDPLGFVDRELGVSVGVAGIAVPWTVTASMAAAWDAASIDPTALIPGAHRDPRVDRQLEQRREKHVAAAQEHYFEHPPVMVRGWQEHLIDDEGRVYLDGLNNVTSIGHAHPALIAAITRQWSLFNSNSRFQYPAIVDFAERLAGLLPAGLDSVFFVNSGSEAVDLALRIARSWTGRRDVLAVREAYHGWTDLSDSVSTSVADNPDALTTRPPWVHTVEAPNSYRGRYRGVEATGYASDAVSTIESLDAVGTPIGAFIAETYYGNAGGIPLPDGYLTEVYAAIRNGGGLCVADEVQVGYGRLGTWFWGFEQQGVVPDIVAVAKGMGNGHPLGAVITSREIAEQYRSEGYFFSSAGGSPVSSIVGMTVLDVMEDEALQSNALLTGAHLKRRLEELATRHPLIGAVHGTGLYLGVEFVRDRETLEPATEETAAICERLRQRGVIMQPTSDRQCVLKIKPPLCITKASADFFVDMLDEVLTTGW
jgi:4-aminobutyrate aminotransferase-like enzyme/Ser/Thr protein kinase RdoA (MazF antagonist)